MYSKNIRKIFQKINELPEDFGKFFLNILTFCQKFDEIIGILKIFKKH